MRVLMGVLTGKREKITLTLDRPKLTPDTSRNGAAQRNNHVGE